MRFFERPPSARRRDVSPQQFADAHRGLQAALLEKDRLERTVDYRSARLAEMLPLLREESALEVTLELEAARLDSARDRERNARETGELRGEAHDPTTSRLAEMETEYGATAERLEAVRAQVREQDAELRRRFGLPSVNNGPRPTEEGGRPLGARPSE